MNEQTIQEEWDVLITFFPKGWKKQAYETRAITRRRNIDNPETLLRVLLIHLADGKSLRSTATHAQETGLCHLNDVSLLQRLRASGEWLRWLAKSLLDTLNSSEAIAPLARRHRVQLVDASMISEPGSTGSDWRLHYSLSLLSLRCEFFKVTDCRVGESFVHFPVVRGDLFIGDRAYCKRRDIFHVLDHGGQVMVRFHSTALPLFNYRGLRFEVLEKLRTLQEPEIGDWNVYLTHESGERVKGRLCAVRKSREASERAKKAILQEARKKQRRVKPETLEYAEYVVIFTTVSRHVFKGLEVMWFYRARWQVELAFKRLKSIMALGHLPKFDPESCKAWLHGKLFLALLVERIFQEAESFSPWGYPLGAVGGAGPRGSEEDGAA